MFDKIETQHQRNLVQLIGTINNCENSLVSSIYSLKTITHNEVNRFNVITGNENAISLLNSIIDSLEKLANQLPKNNYEINNIIEIYNNQNKGN